jgi:hypothetical protein
MLSEIKVGFTQFTQDTGLFRVCVRQVIMVLEVLSIRRIRIMGHVKSIFIRLILCILLTTILT